MIIATLELWQDGQDGPVREFDKEFPSKEHLSLWLREQEKHPFLWYILIGTTETE
jgi:hypothetical protein